MISPLLKLFRWRLSFLNGVAAVGGYCLFPERMATGGVWPVFVGVTLLAAGASALNQVLERDIDRLMVRTSGRPLPCGDLSPRVATSLGAGALLASLPFLACGGSVPVLLGAAAVAWYLVLYTPLKRHTPFALAVGAVCGAVPPVIGWSAAGGEPGDYRVMLLAGLLFLWQVPHFWLFQRRHAEDYRRAGLPLFIPAGTGADSFCRLWLLALAAASSALPAFGVIAGEAARWYLLIPAGLGILAASPSEKLLGPCVNLFPLLVTTVLVIQR